MAIQLQTEVLSVGHHFDTMVHGVVGFAKVQSQHSYFFTPYRGPDKSLLLILAQRPLCSCPVWNRIVFYLGFHFLPDIWPVSFVDTSQRQKPEILDTPEQSNRKSQLGHRRSVQINA